MCLLCPTLTRRHLLQAACFAAAAALAGCGSQTAMEELPGPYRDHLGDLGGALTKPAVAPAAAPTLPQLTVMPRIPPAKTTLGDIMVRSAWTPTPLKVAGATPLDGISKITIHHSGDGRPFTGDSEADVVKHLQIVLRAHRQRGMVDIAYHFAIDRVGRVWQLRWIQYEGQHVRVGKNGVRNNAHNVGIVLIGDFNLQPVTAPARDRLLSLIRDLRTQYAPASKAGDGIPGRPQSIEVDMHDELVDTDCPGKTLRPLILDARKKGLL